MHYFVEDKAVYPICVQANSILKSFNFYLYEENGKLSLIDAGLNTVNCWEALERTLQAQNLSIHDISQILLTHHHEDHVGLVNRIVENVKDIPIYAHPEAIYKLRRDSQFLELRIDFYETLYKEMGCGEEGIEQIRKMKEAMAAKADQKIETDIAPIRNGDTIAGLRALETAGHSNDHVVFIDDEAKWMFGGDHLLGHIASNAIVEPNRFGQRIHSLVNYVNSLKKVSQLEVNFIFSGHGEVIKEPRPLIEKRLAAIAAKSEKIKQLITGGCHTASEIAKHYYKDRYYRQFSLVISEIIGQLDYLEVAKAVTKEKINGVYHYDVV